jgi:hypothetical protein
MRHIEDNQNAGNAELAARELRRNSSGTALAIFTNHGLI